MLPSVFLHVMALSGSRLIEISKEAGLQNLTFFIISKVKRYIQFLVPRHFRELAGAIGDISENSELVMR